MRRYFSVTGGTVLAGLLAFLAGTADGASQPKRVAFRVTLNATVTKDWNSVIDSIENGCPISQRSVGRRIVRLRSARPTTVLVTLGNGRVSYSPAVVRYVRAELSLSGSRTTTVQAPCNPRTTHTRCTHLRRAVGGWRFGFFRSARNEISFRSARLPAFSMACPRESSGVRGIRPGLQDAQGELSEPALMNPRTPTQTAIGTSEVEADLEGAEAGRVVERVRWELTFTRKR
jgi:hypothetical protein